MFRCQTYLHTGGKCMKWMQVNNLSTLKNGSPKTGIVMLNMGGPQTTNQVHDYLLRIMTDRDMIQFPFMQDQIGAWIAKRRTPEVSEKYLEIGGGSPILKWTQLQGKLMCEKLNKISPSTAPHKHYVAFRYVTPFTQDALLELAKDNVKQVVLFSQYPQYSCATSGSSFNDVWKCYKKNGLHPNAKLSVIERWGINSLFIKCYATLIENAIDKLPKEKQKEAIILFSAHSLPLKAVNRGDSYPSEVGATVEMIMKELNYCNPHQLVWQSKVGPLPWLGPFTDAAIKGYVRQGKKNFILVPVAFVNEHIETLHEMDIEFCKDLRKELNIDNILRVPTPNDHPLFIDALANVVKNHLEGGTPVSEKFLIRCPHCINPNCYQSKKWFSKVCSF